MTMLTDMITVSFKTLQKLCILASLTSQLWISNAAPLPTAIAQTRALHHVTHDIMAFVPLVPHTVHHSIVSGTQLLLSCRMNHMKRITVNITSNSGVCIESILPCWQLFLQVIRAPKLTVASWKKDGIYSSIWDANFYDSIKFKSIHWLWKQLTINKGLNIYPLLCSHSPSMGQKPNSWSVS